MVAPHWQLVGLDDVSTYGPLFFIFLVRNPYFYHHAAVLIVFSGGGISGHVLRSFGIVGRDIFERGCHVGLGEHGLRSYGEAFDTWNVQANLFFVY